MTYQRILKRVSYTKPDESWNVHRDFLYENPSFPRALTGIIDESFRRVATWEYDSEGRAVLSFHGDNADKVTLNYVSGGVTVTHHVNSALSSSRTYATQVVAGKKRVGSIAGDPCPACGPKSTVFDGNGFVSKSTDWNDTETTYFRLDSTRPDLETARVEAGNRSDGEGRRTVTTSWHSAFRLPVEIKEYSGGADSGGVPTGTLIRTTAMTHDAAGNVLSRTITDVASGRSRQWAYTYNSNGQVLTADGPRTDVSDVVTYTYYANDHSDITYRGRLQKITNALGHEVKFTEYDFGGKPLTIEEPNGLTTTLTYNYRNLLKTRTRSGETTAYAYDDSGNPIKITMPDGSFLEYAYDSAYRILEIKDNLNNKIAFTRDYMGNVVSEDVKDPSGNIVQAHTREFNALNRLIKDIGGSSPSTQITQYGHDPNGNVISITPPAVGNKQDAVKTYDGLNRLKSVTEKATIGGVLSDIVTEYAHDSLGQLIQVKDPKGLFTNYTINALGELTSLESPDTGVKSYTYDSAGNLSSVTDANGNVVTYGAYDALNRITSVTHTGAGGAADFAASYTYDSCANGIGRLCSIAQTPGGSIGYAYDALGRVTSETRVINGINYVTAYSYDSAGRMSGMTYPGGRQIQYAFDGVGRVSAIATSKSGSSATLLNTATYHPFGGVRQFYFGANQSGQAYTRNYDADGRVGSYSLGSLTQVLTYDAAGRITSIQDQGLSVNRTFSYDEVDRILSGVMPNSSDNQAYTYDATGNRLSQNANSYSYQSASHRLVAAGGTAYSYDANGSVIQKGGDQFVYDARGRLVGAGGSGYGVNVLGERVLKQTGAAITAYHYDRAGRLIAETDGSTGVILKEYVYLNDQPVNVIVSSAPSVTEQFVNETAATFSGNWGATQNSSSAYQNDYRTHPVLP